MVSIDAREYRQHRISLFGRDKHASSSVATPKATPAATRTQRGREVHFCNHRFILFLFSFLGSIHSTVSPDIATGFHGSGCCGRFLFVGRKNWVRGRCVVRADDFRFVVPSFSF